MADVNYKLVVFLLCSFVLGACHDDDVPTNIEPELVTGTAKDISHTEATLTGTVVLKGNTVMPDVWFEYGEGDDLNMTVKDLNVRGGNVEAHVSGLAAGTEYSYRLMGSNGSATLCGDIMTFVTQSNDKPSVGSLSLLSRGPVSVIVSYEILSDGGEPIIETGCSVKDVSSGESWKAIAEPEQQDETEFVVRIGRFEQNATYELRPYAVNKVGETVGEAMTLTMGGNAVTLASPGELDLLMGDYKYSFTSLSIIGQMNGDDLRCLREMMGRNIDGAPTSGRLADVDLTDSRIVEGGGSYGSSRYTENDVVGYGLFADCTGLTNVVLPDGTKTIEKDAFMNCSSLKTITVPASVRQLTPSGGCVALEEIVVSQANSNYVSIDGVLFNSDASRIVWFPMGKRGHYELPASVTSLGDYAFRDCSITSCTLPDGLTELGQCVFYGSKVKQVTLPDNLRLIPTGTFQNCLDLHTIHLGEMTELVSDYVFDKCPLTDIYVDAYYPPVCNDDAFSGTADDFFSTCVLHVPASRVGMYKADNDWGRFDNIVGE